MLYQDDMPFKEIIQGMKTTSMIHRRFAKLQTSAKLNGLSHYHKFIKAKEKWEVQKTKKRTPN